MFQNARLQYSLKDVSKKVQEEVNRVDDKWQIKVGQQKTQIELLQIQLEDKNELLVFQAWAPSLSDEYSNKSFYFKNETNENCMQSSEFL